jgi:drug/metabolite transporter (DMT)-like permease
MGWLWAVFTVIASAGQVARNAMQRELTVTLGTVGATHVRFLFGLPFSVLFLVLVVLSLRMPIPAITGAVFVWALAASVAQIAATALLLAAMRDRSFVVATAYAKTEPVQTAVFGLVFLGDAVTLPLAAAILIATAGAASFSWGPAALGIASGAMFAIAAIGFRGAIRGLETPHFVMAATVALVLGLFLQTAMLTLYLLIADRKTLVAIFKAWRPSMAAGFAGAFASQMWFMAFALETAAKVRTLALVEILFAQIVSRNLFKQSLASREALGIGLIIVGVVVLLNT